MLKLNTPSPETVDIEQKKYWQDSKAPKVLACNGESEFYMYNFNSKHVSIKKNVSFIISDQTLRLDPHY
jgi:hypothetical protein